MMMRKDLVYFLVSELCAVGTESDSESKGDDMCTAWHALISYIDSMLDATNGLLYEQEYQSLARHCFRALVAAVSDVLLGEARCLKSKGGAGFLVSSPQQRALLSGVLCAPGCNKHTGQDADTHVHD